MSFDLYLRLPKDADAETALNLFHQLEAGTAEAEGKYVRHLAAKLLISLDRRYKAFEKDYEEIAKFDGITAQEARARDDSVESNGEAEGKPMAQFIIYDDRMVIHWYSGTTEQEMSRYLGALCENGAYRVVDPQNRCILGPAAAPNGGSAASVNNPNTPGGPSSVS